VKLTCDIKRAAESSTVVISNSTARSLPAKSLVSWTVNFYGDGTQHKQPGFRARLKKNDGNGIVRTLQGQVYACNAWTYVH
jgi:hypothetical protein